MAALKTKISSRIIPFYIDSIGIPQIILSRAPPFKKSRRFVYFDDWTAFGGGVKNEDQNDPFNCACREAFEETYGLFPFTTSGCANYLKGVSGKLDNIISFDYINPFHWDSTIISHEYLYFMKIGEKAAQKMISEYNWLLIDLFQKQGQKYEPDLPLSNQTTAVEKVLKRYKLESIGVKVFNLNEFCQYFVNGLNNDGFFDTNTQNKISKDKCFDNTIAIGLLFNLTKIMKEILENSQTSHYTQNGEQQERDKSAILLFGLNPVILGQFAATTNTKDVRQLRDETNKFFGANRELKKHFIQGCVYLLSRFLMCADLCTDTKQKSVVELVNKFYP